MLRRRLRVTMPHHASLSIKAGLMGAASPRSRTAPDAFGTDCRSRQPVSNLIEHEIAEPLAAITEDAQHPGIDEVSQKDAIPGADFRSNRISRMPRVGAYGECITAVRHESHMISLGQRAVSELLMENGADMRGGAIARQVKLHGYALPACVGVRCNQISRNVAGQNWDRIHAGSCEASAKTPLERRGKPAHEGVPDRTCAQCAPHHIPNDALLRRQMANIFRK